MVFTPDDDRAHRFMMGMSEERAEELAAREEVWRKAGAGESLTDEEKALVGLDEQSWCPDANAIDEYHRKTAAVAHQDSHLVGGVGPETEHVELPTGADIVKMREESMPEWRLFGMKRLFGRRVLRRIGKEHLALFNEAFLADHDRFRWHKRSDTMAVVMIRLVDLDPDLPVLLIAGGDFLGGLSLELTSAGRLMEQRWPVEISSMTVHKDHTAKDSGPKPKSSPADRVVPNVSGVTFPLSLPGRTLELGYSLLEDLRVDIDHLKGFVAETEESDEVAEGVIYGEFKREWTARQL